VHRDIKPDNILLESKPKNLTEKLYIKVIDFGTSALADIDVVLDEHQGTALFMAPEMIMKNYDARCDIWSCGVVLYCMLAGDHPFKSESGEHAATFDAILNNPVPFPKSVWESISPEAKNLVTAMLEKDPNDRISIPEILGHPWIKANENYDESMKFKTLVSLENL
jgi:calcium-dependent protein kinase